MSPATIRQLLHAAAACTTTIAGTSTALAADLSGLPAAPIAGPATVDLIADSRLGCGQGVAVWTFSSGGGQCPFDTAARGASLTAREDVGIVKVEAYATAVHATAGAFTANQLLVSPERRGNETTDFFLVGLKGTAFDERFKFMSEFASTRRVVDDLLRRDWMLADGSGDNGMSATVRVEAKLVSTARFNWSITAEMRSVSQDYAVGRSDTLSRYAAMPGTRLAFSSKARLGELGLVAGLDRLNTDYGEYASLKAGADVYGISLRVVARDSRRRPSEGTTLPGSRTRTTDTYLDLDSHMLAASLLPQLGELPFLVPTSVSVNVRTGETENRYLVSADRFDRASLGVDGTWETPIGETVLTYWRDRRTALTPGAPSHATEMMQVSHFVRRGNWRFGLDAALLRGRGEGASSYDERSWSFGQSVAYSTSDGPEFRLSLGQDRGVTRMLNDSLTAGDSYSQITASLDLSSYLRKRFDRPDLSLTFDYRKALERSDSAAAFDELVERWVDNYRREGFLMSFGMKL